MNLDREIVMAFHKLGAMEDLRLNWMHCGRVGNMEEAIRARFADVCEDVERREELSYTVVLMLVYGQRSFLVESSFPHGTSRDDDILGKIARDLYIYHSPIQYNTARSFSIPFSPSKPLHLPTRYARNFVIRYTIDQKHPL